MKSKHGFILFLYIVLIFDSCTIYDKIFDNPVDFKANEERGIGAPTLVFYPKTQTVTQTEAIIIGSFIVFKEDSTKPFSGAHLQIQFPYELIELDTVLPGLFIKDTNNSTPLFTYTNDNDGIVDIYTYFLDESKIDIEGTGHLADLVFNSLSIGSDSVHYNLDGSSLIDYLDNPILINGIRGAEIIIQ